MGESCTLWRVLERSFKGPTLGRFSELTNLGKVDSSRDLEREEDPRDLPWEGGSEGSRELRKLTPEEEVGARRVNSTSWEVKFVALTVTTWRGKSTQEEITVVDQEKTTLGLIGH